VVIFLLTVLGFLDNFCIIIGSSKTSAVEYNALASLITVTDLVGKSSTHAYNDNLSAILEKFDSSALVFLSLYFVLVDSISSFFF